MNEPNGPGTESPGADPIVLPEIRVTPDALPADESLPEELPAEEPPPEEPPPEEPPIERHDPFAWMRGARWMDRRLSPSGRAAYLLRRDLEAFPLIEGRDPNHADLDAIVKRTVDYIVPIIRREQATDIVYEELEKRREERIAQARAASLAAPAAAEAAKAAARGAATILAAMPASVLAPAVAAAVALKPTTPDDGAFGLGEDLRLRTPPGSLEGEIERRVGDRWESSGIRAVLNSGTGARVLVDDVAGFANAVGTDVAGRLADRGVVGGSAASAGVAKNIHDAIVRRRLDGIPAGPGGVEPPPGFLPIMEMRITSSVDGGETITHAEIRDEDAKNYCPNYAKVQEVGLRAGGKADTMGLPKGPARGQWIHTEAEGEMKTARIEALLRAGGMQELRVEQGFLEGEPIKFLKSGSSKIDVVEKIGKDAACVYDFKTGSATFPDHVRERYLREAAKHFGVSTVYVLPVYVP
jgi:hypothetical protein